MGVATGIVAGLGEMEDKAFICDQSGLWQAVHAFADLDKDEAVVHEGQEVVLGHDAVGDGPNRDAHVLVPGHRRVEIKIGDVKTMVGSIGVETVSFMTSLAVVVSAVGVLTLPG